MYFPSNQNYSGYDYSSLYPNLPENSDSSPVKEYNINSNSHQETAGSAASSAYSYQDEYAPSAPPSEAWDQQPQPDLIDVKDTVSSDNDIEELGDRNIKPLAATSDDSGLAKASSIGLSALSGLATLTFTTLKFTASLGWTVLCFGGRKLFGPSQDQQMILGKRAFELMSEWNRIDQDLNDSMKITKRDFSNLLAGINGQPLTQQRQSKSSLDRLEKSTKIFEEKIKETLNSFKEVLEKEKNKKTMSRDQQGLSKSSLERLERSAQIFKEKVKEIQNNFKLVLQEEKQKIS